MQVTDFCNKIKYCLPTGKFKIIGEVNQPKLFHQLLRAQSLGHILNVRNSKSHNFIWKFKVFTSILKLIVTAPCFSLKVINGKIFR